MTVEGGMVHSRSVAEVAIRKASLSSDKVTFDSDERSNMSLGGRFSMNKKGSFSGMSKEKRTLLREHMKENLESRGFGKDGSNTKWSQLKFMLHEVYVDTCDEYLGVDDLFDNRSITGEELKTHGSLFNLILLDQEEEENNINTKKENGNMIAKMGFSSASLGSVNEDGEVQLADDDFVDSFEIDQLEGLRARRLSGGNFGVSEQAPRKLQKTASQARFIEERANVMKLVMEGTIVSEVTPGEEGKFDIRDQVDLEMYSTSNLEQRRLVKHNMTFKNVALEVFEMLADDKNDVTRKMIPKQTYMIFCLKVGLVATPPPIDLEIAASAAAKDWGLAVGGAEEMDWSTFFDELFGLCDMWVITARAEDYTNFLLKLLKEVTVSENGKIEFVPNEKIQFCRFFNFLHEVEGGHVRHGEEYEGTSVAMDLNGKEVREDEQKHSLLTRDLTVSHLISIKGEKDGIKREMVLEEVTALIANIYSAKMSADDYLNRQGGKGDRFDAFVMHTFRTLHPTRQAARRHMKLFLRSVRKFSEVHPRVGMFRKLCGIPTIKHETVAFIPDLVNRHVIPTIRNCYKKDNGDVATPEDVKTGLGKGVETPTLVALGTFSKALKPNFAGLGVFAEGAFNGFIAEIKENCCVNDEATRFAGSWVDVDKALLESYRIFVFGNKMMSFSMCKGVRAIQRWVRMGMPDWRVDVDVDADVEAQNAQPFASPRQALQDAQKLDTEINNDN